MHYMPTQAKLMMLLCGNVLHFIKQGHSVIHCFITNAGYCTFTLHRSQIGLALPLIHPICGQFTSVSVAFVLCNITILNQ